MDPLIPAAPAAAPTPDATLAIQIDTTKLTIGDLRMFLRLAALKDQPAEAQQAALLDALPTFDRLVVGGIDAYPLSQLGQVVEAVADAMKAAGNPGN